VASELEARAPLFFSTHCIAIPCAHISAIIRNSVSLFLLPRIAAMTALRLAGVKTSGIGRNAVGSGDLETARSFVVLMRVHPVVEAPPLGIAGVEFFVGEFAGLRPAPRLGGEASQHARPAAAGLIVTVGVQAVKKIGDGAPCAEESGT